MIAVLLLAKISKAQARYLKSNEVALFSFKTKSGKIMMLALDSARKYIVYRFGSAGHIDLEYPKDLNNSFEKFKRFCYVRYGGNPNAGTMISQVEFVNEGYTYKLFDQLFTLKEDERYEIGVTVENNQNGKETRIDGIVRTQKGGLLGLKDSELIQLSSEPFGH